jgi:hypothetical protein
LCCFCSIVLDGEVKDERETAEKKRGWRERERERERERGLAKLTFACCIDGAAKEF